MDEVRPLDKITMEEGAHYLPEWIGPPAEELAECATIRKLKRSVRNITTVLASGPGHEKGQLDTDLDIRPAWRADTPWARLELLNLPINL